MSTIDRLGILLPCPRCGEGECEISLNLGTHLLTCECGADFETSEVQALLDRWSKVLAWIESAPKS